MTREETKKNFKNWCQRYIGNDCSEIDMHMANNIIAMLESEPCEAVSRQAVLEYIEGSEAELGHSSENELVCQYIKELPPVAPKPRWIPVSKRLPEDKGCYLTTTIYGEVYCDHWTEISFDRQETVIAWMPLPEPYKAESEDKE